MTIIIIAALNRNGVIGRNGKIPWHLPEDLQRFKELTTGHTVLMGRRTYDSIGKTLPGRRNIVITSRHLPDIEHYHTLEKAIDAVRSEPKVFIIGGGEIFRQSLDRADEMYLTVVENDEEGDTYFPGIEQLIGRDFYLSQEDKRKGYSFLHYVRQA